MLCPWLPLLLFKGFLLDHASFMLLSTDTPCQFCTFICVDGIVVSSLYHILIR